MVQGGVVINMSTLNTIHSIAPDRIVVDAGATWSAVTDAALAHGLTPPVLTAFTRLSVGGTLSAGGIGGMSHLYGMQTDNVLELNVVVADGSELTCSVTQNTDLFNAVRAGLGQVGIITRATLQLMPAPARVRRYQLFYPDQATLTADQRKVLDERRFQHIEGKFVPNGPGGWKFQLEGGVFYAGSAPDDNTALAGLSDTRASAVIVDLSYPEYLSAFYALEDMLRGNGQWFNPHPWWLTFLPDSAAESLATEILDQVTKDGVGPCRGRELRPGPPVGSRTVPQRPARRVLAPARRSRPRRAAPPPGQPHRCLLLPPAHASVGTNRTRDLKGRVTALIGKTGLGLQPR
jgi:FAD/FMN-containing dehydrogenase